MNHLIYRWRFQDLLRELYKWMLLEEILGTLNGHCLFWFIVGYEHVLWHWNISFWFCSSFLTASCRSQELNDANFDCNSEGYKGSERMKFKFDGSFNQSFSSEDNFPNSPDSSESFGETQIDLFHHRHGLLLLHFLATMMFAPSAVAWFQVQVYINSCHVNKLNFCSVSTLFFFGGSGWPYN